ncbi:TonB-dependent receptor family protein [Seonamhaeicola marinus]|uniref:TonB-dependent receptor n=1 Tax=Seonamhaeicola marinus TaxID=1912246 RepID=A0A5D0IN54_9FLAO|nr:TonB-dependent receptor [Seonamhaeicola marinus]TYA84479.1 TonB-dependent receptor [Seonamhaeicola marinus]
MHQYRTLTLILILFTTHLFGQSSSVTGRILDIYNTPLQNVEVTNTAKQQFFSNANGYFELPKEGIYTFSKEGYHFQNLKLRSGKLYLIKLKPNTSQLNEVIVNANHIPKKLKNTSTSISIISTEDIERSNNINITSSLNRTPGIFMQTGALNTNRITILGIGSRNLFGTSKIRAYFKDIPLTDGSGNTALEDFELGSIGRIEVNKGAVSSIYGAGLGGTITLMPKPTIFGHHNLNNEFTFGSFGLLKNLTQLNLHTKKSGFNLTYSTTESEGYRDNNTYNRQTLTFNSTHFLTPKNELAILGSFVDLKAFIPSSLNEDDYLNTPTKAAFTWNSAKGFEDTQRGILGISWTHSFKPNLKQITSIFSSFRDGYEPRPFNILQENTKAYGIRSRLLGDSKLFNQNLKWTLGGEFFKDIHTYSTFENLYQDFPPGNGSVKGNELSNFKENRSYYNIFSEINQNLSKKTIVSFGINLNKTSYTLDDRYTVSQNNADQSGSYDFNVIVSPKFGLSHQFSRYSTFYANVSHGFSPISLEETLLPDGQINNSLKPETGWNFEIGSRGNAFNQKLQYTLSLYRLSVKNLLVARRTSEDQFIGINAGKTHHDGIEASLNYKVISSPFFNLNTTINATLNRYKFEDFVDDENDYSGNDLTGVPKEVINAIIDFSSRLNIYGNINFQYVGRIPITDSNNLYSDNYTITNLKLGFKKNINKNLKTNLFIGLNNIFDTKYASQILINASGFGGRAPRYYYPGNPFNYFGGINFNYSF